MKKTLSLLAMVCFFSPLASPQMKIHIIDVGQAGSILLEFKSAAVLVDAGGSNGPVPGRIIFV